MSKFTPGEQVLTELDIRDFELFYDYVKKGLLRPYNDVGEPKPPPDISFKLNRLEDLHRELDLLKIRYPILTRSHEETISLAKKDLRAVAGEIYYSKPAFSEHEYLEKEAKTLKEELSKIDDIYSWKNYDLPDPEAKGKRILNDLVDSLYIEEEVQKLKKKDDVEQKESQALDVSPEKDSLQLADLKKEEYLKNPAIIKLVKEAKNEIDIIHNALVRNVGFSGRKDLDHVEDLKEEAIETLTNQNNAFIFIRREYLKDRNLFSNMLASPGHELRYFKGTLLQKVVKDQTGNKIAKDKLRNL